MAVTLASLCEKSGYLYGMRVIAGKDGMTNIVQWVHSVEDTEVSDFLHGGELIFSTGIANKGQDWMLPFVKNLIENQVSGLVLNIGPYIKSIPQEVISYCNEKHFPLLDIPWKTRIVDISRDFCNRIILNERKEESIGDALKNFIFFPNEYDKYIPVLECNDFSVDADYAIIGIKADMADNISTLKPETAFERIIYSYKKHWGGFKVDNMLFYVLSNFTNAEIESLVEKLQAEQEKFMSVNKLYIAVSKTDCNIKSLSKAYQIVLKMLKLSQRRNISPMFYEKLEIKKLILAVDDNSLLESIYNENLRKLEIYDRDNGTDYLNFLRLYLKYDGSVQKVAEETFVHRNTINYQLAKIKKILGNNLKTFEERFKLILAFEIKDVM